MQFSTSARKFFTEICWFVTTTCVRIGLEQVCHPVTVYHIYGNFFFDIHVFFYVHGKLIEIYWNDIQNRLVRTFAIRFEFIVNSYIEKKHKQSTWLQMRLKKPLQNRNWKSVSPMQKFKIFNYNLGIIKFLCCLSISSRARIHKSVGFECSANTELSIFFLVLIYRDKLNVP